MDSVERDVRVEIPVQCHANSVAGSGERKDLLVRRSGHSGFADVKRLPALGAQDARRVGREPLAGRNPFHSTRNQSMRWSRFAAAN